MLYGLLECFFLWSVSSIFGLICFRVACLYIVNLYVFFIMFRHKWMCYMFYKNFLQSVSWLSLFMVPLVCRCSSWQMLKYSHSFSSRFTIFMSNLRSLPALRSYRCPPMLFSQKPCCFNLLYLALKIFSNWYLHTMWGLLPHGHPVCQAFFIKTPMLFSTSLQ